MAQAQDNMPLIKAPSNLPELVRTAFHKARTNGELIYYPTQVALLDVNSVPFQLRFSPALANKPTNNNKPKAQTQTLTPTAETTKKGTLNPPAQSQPLKLNRPAFDPFENPDPGLLVAQLPPAHFLVLNKFAVVPEHFILVTEAWKEQTHLLELEDLVATRACILAYDAFTKGNAQEGGEEAEYGELFAFFNSGEHSGASQPHRHVQLLPVERMRDGLEGLAGGIGGRNRWEVLANKLVADDGGSGLAAAGTGKQKHVPFRTFAERLRPGISDGELHALYLGLYRRACAAVLRSQAGGEKGTADGEAGYMDQTEGEAKISYNMAMTRDVLVVMPRLAEGAVITVPDGKGENVIGKLALNGTVLAGTALVKSQREWDYLRDHPEVVVELLGRIGVSSLESKV